MGNVVKPGSSFWAPLFFGKHAPSSLVHPSVLQTVELMRGNEHLENLEKISAIGHKATLEVLHAHTVDFREFSRDVKGELGNISNSLNYLGYVSFEILAGVNAFNQNLREGFSHLSDQNQALMGGVDTVNQNLRTGFTHLADQNDALMEGVDTINENLRDGFSHLSDQNQALMGGVDTVNQNLRNGFAEIGIYMQAGFQGAIEYLAHINHTLADGFEKLAVQNANSFNLFDEKIIILIQESRAHAQALLKRLNQIRDNQLNAQEIKADDNFIAGMNFINGLDFGNAERIFEQIRLEIWPRHFPSYFMSAHIAYLRANMTETENLLWQASSQARNDAERAMSYFYRGRLNLERQDKQGYKEAEAYFKEARQLRPNMSAIQIEELVAHMLSGHVSTSKLDAFISEVNGFFYKNWKNNYSKRRLCQAWYSMALSTVHHDPDLAFFLASYALNRDPIADDKHSEKIISNLYLLNPHTAETLLKLLSSQFTWLSEFRDEQ